MWSTSQVRHLSVPWFPYFDPAGELKVADKFDLTYLRFLSPDPDFTLRP